MTRQEELEQEIKLLNIKQKGLKKLINKFYGGLGCQASYFYNKDIAESITTQGRDLIKYSETSINNYFQKAWHLDTELHKKLNIKTEDITPITKDVICYIVTDANYIDFETVLKSVNNLHLDSKKRAEFCLKIITERLNPFIVKQLEKYAQKWGVSNRMVFELENIMQSVIFVAKSNYVYRVVYDDGFVTKKITEAKGLPCVKPSHPKKARELLMRLIDIILDNNGNVFLERDIIPVLEKYYEEFKIADIDDICTNQNINNISSYAIKKNEYRLTQQSNGRGGVVKHAINIVTNQYHTIETEKRGVQIAEISEEFGDYFLIKGCSTEVKGCLAYNNNVANSGNTKYLKIKNKDKVKIYISADKQNKVFCYPARCFNSNICPSVDYREQFYKVVISPLNAILEAIGLSEINKDFERVIKFKKPLMSVVRKYGLEENVPFVCENTKTGEIIPMPKMLYKYTVAPKRKKLPEHVINDYKNIIDKFGSDLLIRPTEQ